jgi:hypothetical protein
VVNIVYTCVYIDDLYGETVFLLYYVYVYSLQFFCDKLPYMLHKLMKLVAPEDSQNGWVTHVGALYNRYKFCANSW